MLCLIFSSQEQLEEDGGDDDDEEEVGTPTGNSAKVKLKSLFYAFD